MRALVCVILLICRVIFACRQCQSQSHDHHRTQMPNQKQCNWWWKAIYFFFIFRLLVVLSLAATASLIELASIQVFSFATVLSLLPSIVCCCFCCCCSVRDSCTRQRVKNNNFVITCGDAYCRYNAYMCIQIIDDAFKCVDCLCNSLCRYVDRICLNESRTSFAFMRAIHKSSVDICGHTKMRCYFNGNPQGFAFQN